MSYECMTSTTMKKRTKTHFTAAEDEMLKILVMQNPENDWRLIAAMMNGRTPRQCRERYISYLSPELNTSVWTQDEDELLLQKLKEFGPKWMKMVPFFSGRSDSNIKNRWYKHLKRHFGEYIENQCSGFTKESEMLENVAERYPVNPEVCDIFFGLSSDQDDPFQVFNDPLLFDFQA